VGGKDKKGRTPLFLAVTKGDMNLVRMLMTHGARVEGEELREGGKGGGGGWKGGRREIEEVLREQTQKQEEKHKKEEGLSQQQQQQQHREEMSQSSSASGHVVEVECEMPLIPVEEREGEEEMEEGLEEEVLYPLRLELPLDGEEKEENRDGEEEEGV